MTLNSYLGPIACINLAAERISVTVVTSMPPSKIDASFIFGVTIFAAGNSSSLDSDLDT